MARTFSGDMPNVNVGVARTSARLASLSLVVLSAEPFGCGATADTPQKRIPMATSAIGINHFTFGRRGALDDTRGDGRGGGLTLCGVAARAGAGAPGRRP